MYNHVVMCRTRVDKVPGLKVHARSVPTDSKLFYPSLPQSCREFCVHLMDQGQILYMHKPMESRIAI